MRQSIVYVALVVREYDEAIEFYTKKLHFTLVEDTYEPEQDKRWVLVAPPGSSGTQLLLAGASSPEQQTLAHCDAPLHGVLQLARFVSGERGLVSSGAVLKS